MKTKIFFTLALIPILIAVIISVFVGVEFTDTGFILGLSHRISLGQEIYTDFDFVRPPLSPWLWHLPLSLNLENPSIWIRFTVVLQKLISALFIYFTLKSFKVDEFTRTACAVIVFIFLLHHFPSEPWYTVDGLFFVSLSILLFVNEKIFFGLIAALIASQIKQSFYFFPVFYFVLISLIFPKRILIYALSAASFFAFIFYNFDMVEFYLSTSNTTNLYDFFRYAIIPHFAISPNIWPNIWFLLSTILVFLIPILYNFSSFLKFKTKKIFTQNFLKNNLGERFEVLSIDQIILFAATVPALIILLIFINQLFNSDTVNFSAVTGSHAIMSLTLLHFIYCINKKGIIYLFDRKTQTVMLLLVGAWCSSISWGYNNYLFAFGLLISANVLISVTQIRFNKKLIALIIFLLADIFLVLRLYTPYRTQSPLLVPYRQVTEGYFKNVFVSPHHLSILNSVDRISNLSGCVDFYPSITSGGLLGGYLPPLRVDWKLDVEFPSLSTGIDTLKQMNCKLFVEKIGINTYSRSNSTMLNIDEYQQYLTDFDANFYLIDFGKLSEEQN